MISILAGKVLEIGNRSAVVGVGGIGYKVNMTDDAIHGLKEGMETKFWTHLAIREDAHDLYGFPTKKERDFFELLISVSGIGPKSALNILSAAAVETLASAVRTGSTAHLVKVSGLGKKTAEKIVLELKDKLGAFANTKAPADMSSEADAIEALKALGYDANEAREALKKVDGKVSDTSAKVKAALKVLT